MKGSTVITAVALLVALFMSGCGGDGSGSSQNQQADQQKENGLTSFEQKHGIGPVTEKVSLNGVDMEMAQKGKETFELKCSACHKLNERYIGPALGDVLDRRSPTYVMNMILNPDGMVKEHPEAKKLMQEYLSPMPNQGLSKEEARAIVEYFASDLE
ncbi:c-type cytochrome [Gracilimonas mengyeensis]|uniref:Cytochrome c n=1 Tax=Gracilimonas mengyeensis TaxID=1302730 RepID=A0A521F1A5_9BACT|nr:cytochrome c [Gracilimonas mengyeensis]SMO89965.1 Cytochrome c [Gracilimonas mengyeensis]